MPLKRILILGGTREARDLANQLAGLGCDVTSSLAGVTENPALPAGHVRRGGFGGVKGLAQYLSVERYDHVIDATHPFAAQISKHAAQACQETDTRLLRLERKAWTAAAGDQWISAADFPSACDSLPHGAPVMMTLGRKEIAIFFARADLRGVVRMIEPPDVDVPPAFKLVLQRPPFSLSGELALMREHRVGFLLCKNSGGPRPEKLDAARELAVPVIMVERPGKPEVQTVETCDEVVARLFGRGARTG